MGIYNNLLVVVDLTPESHFIIARAQALAADGAALSLMHVVEYMPMEPMGETVLPAVQLEGELVARAKEKLALLAAEHGLTHSRQIVTMGNIKTEIQSTAQQCAADLIVVGNHPRRGLKALVNFTEDAVLHVSPCDVLAVHLPNRAG
ncbi:MAG: universal stress protein [Steroidobacteraceae bacterium]